ncbi:MAG TPA: acyl-CoA dehydratase activase-related protein [Candidatus Limnocylindrales bacterium]|nr:acyl-CoA dehydratase activase-related protein [Candidatus Limnocylindrales bacterium]
MATLTLPRWFARTPSAAVDPSREPSRTKLRIGIPRVLNLWSTHQFWVGLFGALGIEGRQLVFSSDTSEEQGREFGKGRGTVDCCYPVKCISGHYGELIFGQREKLDILFSPMIYNLPSFLSGHVAKSLTCPRVMAAPENIRAGFVKERDVFAEQGIRYVAPFVSLDEPLLVPKQLFEGLHEAIPGLTPAEMARAVNAGYAALHAFNDRLRRKSREVLEWCARENRACLLVLARPYHMDPGIGHEIEVDLQAYGYPVLWAQYFPIDADLMSWAFGEDVAAGTIRSPFDIRDVWPSSYSSNTNEILWGAKAAARFPWVACVVRLASYECGMDQPTYTPVQQIVERSGTLFFSFQDLDSTKPAGSVKIRVETVTHYLEKYAGDIIAKKLAAAPPGCPLLRT